jgi:hypothetical protein
MQFPKPRRGVLVPRKQTVRKLRGISHNDRIARKGGNLELRGILFLSYICKGLKRKTKPSIRQKPQNRILNQRSCSPTLFCPCFVQLSQTFTSRVGYPNKGSPRFSTIPADGLLPDWQLLPPKHPANSPRQNPTRELHRLES